jgi:hypothetical protein
MRSILKQLPSNLDAKQKLSQTNHRITRINQPLALALLLALQQQWTYWLNRFCKNPIL